MTNPANEWREAIIDLGVEVDTHQDGDVFIRTFTFNEAQLQAFLDQHSAHLVERIEGLMEQLADIEHERWGKWQAYMHSKCVEHENGKGEWVCFPAELYRRWERQINTPYAELSEAEKESDREQVRPYLKLITDQAIDIIKDNK